MSFESIYERDSNRRASVEEKAMFCVIFPIVYSSDVNEDLSEFISPPLPLAPCPRIENKTF